MTNDNIKVMVVDDHALFREGVKFVLSQMDRVQVVGEAENGAVFLSLLKRHLPDVVFMDISMPEMDGVEAVERALALYPRLKVIALSSYGDEVYYYRMIRAGAVGFVLKKAGKDDLETALDAVMKGESYFPGNLMRKLLFKVSNKGEMDNISLSRREKEVLVLICQGYTNTEMAAQLFISPKTVDNHRSALLQKTGTRNAAHLVMFAIANGLVHFDR
ncbi:DNA-binding response regulator [Marinilabiliaceae bacterium JC017]|nr:DNA-binding response regulator [Marinilabiliaceae bacterium JC017]